MTWALNDRFGSMWKGRDTNKKEQMCSMNKSKVVWEEEELWSDGMEIVCYMITGNKAEFQGSSITKQRNLDTVHKHRGTVCCFVNRKII